MLWAKTWLSKPPVSGQILQSRELFRNFNGIWSRSRNDIIWIISASVGSAQSWNESHEIYVNFNVSKFLSIVNLFPATEKQILYRLFTWGHMLYCSTSSLNHLWGQRMTKTFISNPFRTETIGNLGFSVKFMT